MRSVPLLITLLVFATPHAHAAIPNHFIDVDEVPECKVGPLIDYVKEKYEVNIHGIDCLFYPAKHPKRLWILFAGATINRYTMWSWFWRKNEDWDETACLFLKDDQIRWYFGTEEKPLTQTYCDIINHFITKCNLSTEDVYAIGHSMGGYAAIRFALLLRLQGVFALRPQINWEYGYTYFFSIKKLKTMWVNLDELLLQSDHVPFVYLHFGDFGPDKDAGKKFVNALMQKHAFAIIEKTENPSHMGYHLTKAFIEATLNYMETLGSLNAPA